MAKQQRKNGRLSGACLSVKLEKAVKALEASPLFEMSKASMENFHSNFWAWLVKHDPERFASVFFDELAETKCDAKREEHRRDLTIWPTDPQDRSKTGGRRLYVVENKMKTLPNVRQLERYRDDSIVLKDEFVGGVYSGFQKLDSEPKGWQYVSFGDIVNRIAGRRSGCNRTLFDLLDCYVAMSQNLSDVVSLTVSSLGKTLPFIDHPNLSKLERLGLRDIVFKLSASRFCDDRLRERIGRVVPEAISGKRVRVDVSTGFNHKKWNVTVKLVPSSGVEEKDLTTTRKRKPDSRVEIGLQVEDRQFRRFVEVVHPRRGASAESIWERYSELKWFWNPDFDLCQWETGIPTDEMNVDKSSFRKYGSRFVYQYRTLGGNDIAWNRLEKEFQNQIGMLLRLSRKDGFLDPCRI